MLDERRATLEGDAIGPDEGEALEQPWEDEAGEPTQASR